MPLHERRQRRTGAARSTAPDTHRLRDRLAASAAAQGLLNIAYRVVDSPVGALLLARTPAGLARVAYAAEGHHAVLAQLADEVSPRILRAAARLDDVARELDEYFARTRRSFDVPLDLRLAHGFRREVLSKLPQIRYGTTSSYADVARQTGKPRAYRATGTACATNPLPVVVPCHRVVLSDGTAGRYVGGIGAKLPLLALEHAA